MNRPTHRDNASGDDASGLDWYNHRRLHEHCGDIPPAELEAAHYRHTAVLAEAGTSTN